MKSVGELLKKLRRGLRNSGIDLPRAHDHIVWELERSGPHDLLARIPLETLESNLQEDGPSAATFALVMAFWARILFQDEIGCRVALEPRPASKKARGSPLARRANRQRALLVLHEYEQLFGLKLESDERWEWPDGAVVLNMPKSQRDVRPKLPAGDAEQATRRADGDDKTEKKDDKPEKKIEKQFAREHRWAEEFLDPCERFHNQLPLGLFQGSVKDRNRLTPGQGSQLDFWGRSKTAFHAFELKVGRNRKVGLLSQAFFYARVLQRVAFDQPDGPRFEPTGGPLAGIKGVPIRMWLCLNEAHPLLWTKVRGRWRTPLEMFNAAIDPAQLRFGIAPFDLDAETKLVARWRFDEVWPEDVRPGAGPQVL